MATRTADKYVVMLRPVWNWAIIERKLTSAKMKANPWDFARSQPRTDKDTDNKRRHLYQGEVQKLFAATERGERGGDALRLSIATGVRINELILLAASDVEPDGSGFELRTGKSKNAARFIPLVHDAQDIIVARMTAHGDTGRVFPEWPIKASDGKCGAVTNWFIHLRRKLLGAETEGEVVLHSTRHTWRTMARRAGVPDADVNDLGGWAGPKSSNSVYDHGLLREQLTERQERVWAELRRQGYLVNF